MDAILRERSFPVSPCPRVSASSGLIPQEALMDDSKLRELIAEKLEDGSLSCQDAHTIAEKLGVHLSLVGRVCNEEDNRIKITNCLLGCF